MIDFEKGRQNIRKFFENPPNAMRFFQSDRFYVIIIKWQHKISIGRKGGSNFSKIMENDVVLQWKNRNPRQFDDKIFSHNFLLWVQYWKMDEPNAFLAE